MAWTTAGSMARYKVKAIASGRFRARTRARIRALTRKIVSVKVRYRLG
jgi:hypothetical protein